MRGWFCIRYPKRRTRHKRLVRETLPKKRNVEASPDDIDKLIYYAFSSPERLEQIGKQILKRASADVRKKRMRKVLAEVEVMDQLLAACQRHTIDIFAENYLRMVEKLLEASDPKFQVLGAECFVKFSEREEDTASYHQKCGYFICTFTEMCRKESQDVEVRESLRCAGVMGLEGIVRKTVPNSFVEAIWDPEHMERIVSSLLLNMRAYPSYTKQESKDPQERNAQPGSLAETCFVKLIAGASFTHIGYVLNAVLNYLDENHLWIPNLFAVHTFRVIVFSMPAQHSYKVLETLMSHLVKYSGSTAKIRTCIADVLSKTAVVAAGECVGPSTQRFINSLLTQLRQSVASDHLPSNTQFEEDEKLYQEALVNALSEFAIHMPHHQTIEVMTCIMNQVPNSSAINGSSAKGGDAVLQSMLLKSLLKVGTMYRTVHFGYALQAPLLEALLRMSLVRDAKLRLLVHQILQTLMDRHDNLPKLASPTVKMAELKLTLQTCSHLDVIFIKKHGTEIFHALCESFRLKNNSVENMKALYATYALLSIELCCKETLMNFILPLIAIQDVAIADTQLSISQKCNLHAIVISLLVLVQHIVPVKPLMEYSIRLVNLRQQRAPYLLPVLKIDHRRPSHSTISAEYLLDQVKITELLVAGGVDTAHDQPLHLWVDALAVDIDDVNPSPGMKTKLPKDITFESMKKVLKKSRQPESKVNRTKKKKLNEAFRTATFQELVSLTESNNLLQSTLHNIFTTQRQL